MKQKRILKKLGFFKDRDGLYTRYILEQGNWDSHLLNCKKNILKSSETKNKELCIVLGSGWWLDIPVEELSKTFKRLILVDITHPKQIKHLAEKYKNIELIQTDITQISSFFLSVVKSKNENNLYSLISKNNDFGLENLIYEADFVVSANLLTQLSVFFEEYLSRKKYFTNEAILQFSKLIQENHLRNLPQNKTCLIVDYKQRTYNSKNEFMTEKDRVYISLPENKIKNKWVWDFDLKGNFRKGEKVFFDVKLFDV